MTDKDLIYQFNDDIDGIVNDQSIEDSHLTGENQELLKLAQLLAEHKTRTVSNVEEPLRKHLLDLVNKRNTTTRDAPIHSKRLSLNRAAMVTLAVFAILVFSTLTVPPIRAFAQDVLRRIGNFIFTNAPSDAENYVATLQSGTPTPTPDPKLICNDCQQVYESESLSIAEANQKAGFPVYAVGYLPDDYTPMESEVLFTGQTITVDTSYRMELQEPLQDGFQTTAIIAIEQTQLKENAEPWIKNVGDLPIVEVNIRGITGAWVEGIPIQPYQVEDEWQIVRWNQLIWEENGYNFVLQTNMPTDQLSLEEMLKIAESLKP